MNSVKGTIKAAIALSECTDYINCEYCVNGGGFACTRRDSEDCVSGGYEFFEPDMDKFITLAADSYEEYTAARDYWFKKGGRC